MSETAGIITRIGKWIDYKWAAKATWLDIQEQEEACCQRAIVVAKATGELAQKINALAATVDSIGSKIVGIPSIDAMQAISKENADLKSRLEKLELYVGMKRVMDPTKPAVAKSAFAM